MKKIVLLFLVAVVFFPIWITGSPVKSKIIAACDNSFELFVNSKSVLKGNNWTKASIIDNIELKDGDIITVKAKDAGGQAAFMLELVISGKRIGTNSQWKVKAPGKKFQEATEYGKYGVAPWRKNIKGMPADTPAKWIWSKDPNNHNAVSFQYTVQTGYQIGDRGPGGGWIFHVNDNDNDDWKYLEVAPEDTGDKLGTAAWGCKGTDISSVRGRDSMVFGKGKSNTKTILKKCKEDNCAARYAAAYRGGGKKDWYLPAYFELTAIYLNLHKKGIGNFKNGCYYCSNQFNKDKANYFSFGNGQAYWADKRGHRYVRPVRSFK